MNAVVPGQESWAQSLIRSDKGSLLGTIANTLTILANDKQWDGVLGFDEFRDQPMFLRPPPWFDSDRDGEAEPSNKPVPCTDQDCTRLVAWIEREWRATVSPPKVWACIEVAARKRRYHPVKQYLESLQWDAVQRLPSWLRVYMGAEETKYTSFVGISFLLGAVARIFDPGCKVDTAPVFEGAQGARKSSGVQTLFGIDWTSDTGVDLQSKDRFMDIQGLWAMEFQEMDALKGADNTRAKAYMSSRTDRFRKPYGHTSVSIPRKCVFYGTSNTDDYLNDPTGGRRWFPVACGRIDIEAIARDRDMLWAEAVARYASHERWWTEDEATETQCREMQASRLTVDPWKNTITDWVLNKLLTREFITTGEIMQEALGMQIEKRDRGVEMRVAACLKGILGPDGRPALKRRQTWENGQRRWVYAKVGDAETPTTPTTPTGPEQEQL